MPRMSQLEAHFIRHIDHGGWRCVETIAEATGVMFLCPKCFEAKGGPIGTHSIVLWSRSRGVPEDMPPGGRWKIEGTCIDDLTLNADAPSTMRSVKLLSGCLWHGFVTNGETSNC